MTYKTNKANIKLSQTLVICLGVNGTVQAPFSNPLNNSPYIRWLWLQWRRTWIINAPHPNYHLHPYQPLMEYLV